jgi:hypothetical protein
LVATSAHGFREYREFGFDALSEFLSFRVQVPNIEPFITTTDFRNPSGIRLVRDILEHETLKSPDGGRVHPGLMLGWDNSARHPTRGTIVHGVTVSDFKRWLEHCIARARCNPRGERFVFINAWNEWAEGTYLEPDMRFGYAFLAACAETLRETSTAQGRA